MRLADLDGRRVGIWGFGREGRAALHAARDRAAHVLVHTPEPVEPEPAAEFTTDPRALMDCDVVIRSPGVSAYDPHVAALRAHGVELTTGTRIWFAELDPAASVLAFTGTKGKSTTASLAAHLAEVAGGRVRLAGNVGTALLELLGEPPAELYVVELSSYQLADLEARPAVGVVLNLFREHLDWHGGEERYHADKLRLVAPGAARTAVLNATDARLAEWGPAHRPDARWYGDARGVHLFRDLFLDVDGMPLAARSDLRLAGDHNALNACAALEALTALNRLPEDLPAALRTFSALPHRLEVVAEDGRTWVNDSISTTPESAMAALASFPGRPVTLIAGGYDRGQRYDDLAAALGARRPAATVIAVPDTGPRLLEALHGSGVHGTAAPDLETAVKLARRVTLPGGVVLLSPAAPSFNAYASFERRGEHFRRLAPLSSP